MLYNNYVTVTVIYVIWQLCNCYITVITDIYIYMLHNGIYDDYYITGIYVI